MAQIEKNQCPSNREFPEFFKTHPTLICRSIVKASRSLQTKPAMLFNRTCNHASKLKKNKKDINVLTKN